MAKDKRPALSLRASHEVLQLIGEIDEFKGRWEALRTLSPERLRAFRAVAVLEQLATLEAKQLLESLAGGPAEARLTQEVKASLARLAQVGNKP